MIKPISPVVKGLITAVIMILVTLAIFSSKVSPGSPLQFLPIIIYAIGMVWNMITYRRTPAFNYKFGNAFGQGFRFFIVVTLMMVLFTTIFLKTQPQFKEEGARLYREHLIKDRNKTPQEIETEVSNYKEHYNTGFISASIFRYLIIGAFVTAGISAVITQRKN